LDLWLIKFKLPYLGNWYTTWHSGNNLLRINATINFRSQKIALKVNKSTVQILILLLLNRITNSIHWKTICKIQTTQFIVPHYLTVRASKRESNQSIFSTPYYTIQVQIVSLMTSQFKENWNYLYSYCKMSFIG
jgi:hypothetical protein